MKGISEVNKVSKIKAEEKSDSNANLELNNKIADQRMESIQAEYLGDVLKDQNELEKELEIKRGYRIVSDDNSDKKYLIFYPSLAIENNAIQFRVSKFRELAKRYVPLKKIRAELKETGVWTELDDEMISNLKTEVQNIQLEIENERLSYGKEIKQLNLESDRLTAEKERLELQSKLTKHDEKRLKYIDKRLEQITNYIVEISNPFAKLSVKFKDKYTQLIELSIRKLSYESGSLENQLSNMVIYYKIVNSTFEAANNKKVKGKNKNKDIVIKGRPIWKSVDEFINDSNTTLVQKILIQAQDFWQGGESSFFGSLPESIVGGLTGMFQKALA